MNYANSLNIAAEKLIQSYIEKIAGFGYNVSDIIQKQYNYEISVINGNESLKILVYFGKKGISTIFQGNKESKIYNTLSEIIFGKSIITESSLEIGEPESYIGTDESGKGDYFGPLVIAGVYVDKYTSEYFKKIGVKDSKILSGASIKKLASEIKLTSREKFEVISISPAKYNELYKKIGNVNKILGWAHARVLENLLSRCAVVEAISDKFGDESLIKSSLQTCGKKILLHQFTKAERFTAVAAASIIARDTFSRWFDEKEKEIKIKLPKGAGGEVERAAEIIIDKLGEKSLNDLVKIHFKTTKKINRSNY